MRLPERVCGLPDDTSSGLRASLRFPEIVPIETNMAGGRRDRPTVLVCDDEPVLRMLARATLVEDVLRT
jgi:hypothetical protein